MGGEKRFVSRNLWRAACSAEQPGRAQGERGDFWVVFSNFYGRDDSDHGSCFLKSGEFWVGGTYGSRSHPLRLRSRPGRCSAG